MRKLILKMSMSLDGFVSTLDNDNRWIFKNTDAESTAWSAAQSGDAGLIIMGRKSFEGMAPYWPTASGPFAEPMNTIPKAVFTRTGYRGMDRAQASTPAALSWAEARIFSGDLADGIRKLKQEPGKPIAAIGGADFARNLIATGLIDEYVIVIHPIALGAGLPIFNGIKQPLDLKLTNVKTFAGGIAVNHYRSAT